MPGPIPAPGGREGPPKGGRGPVAGAPKGGDESRYARTALRSAGRARVKVQAVSAHLPPRAQRVFLRPQNPGVSRPRNTSEGVAEGGNQNGNQKKGPVRRRAQATLRRRSGNARGNPARRLRENGRRDGCAEADEFGGGSRADWHPAPAADWTCCRRSALGPALTHHHRQGEHSTGSWSPSLVREL